MDFDVVKILGVRPTSYEKDGVTFSGFNVYYGTLMDPKSGGKGYSCDRCFLSPDRFANCALDVGKEYYIIWNKYGKVKTFSPINK